LHPADVAKGWAHVAFSGDAGPFAALAASLGMGWLATILYIDAYVSPGGTGLMYVTGGSRILFAVGELGAGPRWLTRLNNAQVPLLSVLVMWAVGVLFLLPFPAWQKMVNYITSVTVLTFGLGPVVLLILRENQPDLKRAFRLPAAGIIAPVAFVASNWIVYWTGYQTNSFLFILVAVGFALYAGWYHLVAGRPAAEFGWKHISWLLAWFGGMWILSALGDVGGGYGVLSFWPGVIAVAIWSLVVIWLAKRSALPAEQIAQEMVRIESTL
jgi:amino acid transporter